MFIVSVYDLQSENVQEVTRYSYYRLPEAINDYIALTESYNPDRYGVLLYTDNGRIIHGFGEEV